MKRKLDPSHFPTTKKPKLKPSKNIVSSNEAPWLPNDVLRLIFSYAWRGDLGNCCLVSKQWHFIASTDEFGWYAFSELTSERRSRYCLADESEAVYTGDELIAIQERQKELVPRASVFQITSACVEPTCIKILNDDSLVIGSVSTPWYLSQVIQCIQKKSKLVRLQAYWETLPTSTGDAETDYVWHFIGSIDVKKLDLLIRKEASLLFEERDLLNHVISTDEEASWKEFCEGDLQKPHIPSYEVPEVVSQPSRISQKIAQYQLDALNWMINVENNVKKEEKLTVDKALQWTYAQSNLYFLPEEKYTPFYTAHQKALTTQIRYKGGIFADAPGLNPYLTLIALTQLNTLPSEEIGQTVRSFFTRTYIKSKATLIFCPPSGISAWEKSLSTYASSLSYAVIANIKGYHKQTIDLLINYDVLVVSSGLLSSPTYVKKYSTSFDDRLLESTESYKDVIPPLSRIFWHRLIMVDGQQILDAFSFRTPQNTEYHSLHSSYVWYNISKPISYIPGLRPILRLLFPFADSPFLDVWRGFNPPEERLLVMTLFSNLYWRNTMDTIKQEPLSLPLEREIHWVDFHEVEQAMLGDRFVAIWGGTNHGSYVEDFERKLSLNPFFIISDYMEKNLEKLRVFMKSLAEEDENEMKITLQQHQDARSISSSFDDSFDLNSDSDEPHWHSHFHNNLYCDCSDIDDSEESNSDFIELPFDNFIFHAMQRSLGSPFLFGDQNSRINIPHVIEINEKSSDDSIQEQKQSQTDEKSEKNPQEGESMFMDPQKSMIDVMNAYQQNKQKKKLRKSFEVKREIKQAKKEYRLAHAFAEKWRSVRPVPLSRLGRWLERLDEEKKLHHFIQSLNVLQLQEQLQNSGQKKTGVKADLQRRLYKICVDTKFASMKSERLPFEELRILSGSKLAAIVVWLRKTLSSDSNSYVMFRSEDVDFVNVIHHFMEWEEIQYTTIGSFNKDGHFSTNCRVVIVTTGHSSSTNLQKATHLVLVDPLQLTRRKERIREIEAIALVRPPGDDRPLHLVKFICKGLSEAQRHEQFEKEEKEGTEVKVE